MLVKDFVLALWAHWWPLMSCAAFTILAIVAELKKKSSRWVTQASIGLAIGFLMVSAYLAWRDQVDKTIQAQNNVATLQSELNKLTIPNFRAEVGTVMNFRVSPKIGNQGKSTTVILAEMTIINTGAPSVAEGFSILVKLPNGEVHRGQLIAPPAEGKDIVINSNNHGMDLRFSRSHYLPLSAGDQPIPTGGGVTGFVWFAIPNVEQERLKDGGATIMFKDVAGKTYSAELSMTRLDFNCCTENGLVILSN